MPFENTIGFCILLQVTNIFINKKPIYEINHLFIQNKIIVK